MNSHSLPHGLSGDELEWCTYGGVSAAKAMLNNMALMNSMKRPQMLIGDHRISITLCHMEIATICGLMMSLVFESTLA